MGCSPVSRKKLDTEAPLKMKLTTDKDLCFTELDRHFADLMAKLSGNSDRDLWLAAALTSHLTQEGHVCLDLGSFAGGWVSCPDNPAQNVLCCPPLADWVRALKSCRVVGSPGDFRPLILDKSNRLYLHRYWRYERLLADFIRARINLVCHDVNDLILQNGLNRLFPRAADDGTDWRRIAAVTAARRMFSVITGGPGTGKTSTVVKILALLIEQAGGSIDIALTAPTGKAAAKLKDSVRSAKETLNCVPEVRAAIPDETFTLHRLLGTIPGSAQFRFHRENQLPHRVVVIDEASMVDLPLMTKLTQAMADDARLILLGDKDQLASVEPGSVFGDICQTRKDSLAASRHAEATASAGLGVLSPLVETATTAPSIVVLQKSFRFGENSGIHLLSQAVNAGDGASALALLAEGACPDIAWHDIPAPHSRESCLETKIVDGYRRYLEAPNIKEAFEMLASFRILCGWRRGPYGVISIGEIVQRVLTQAGLLHARGRWYHGLPIMINENDYSTKLFNGDLGIVFAAPEGNASESSLRVFFPREGDSPWSILPMRLPAHENAYALTVHKSQGSEFDEVLLLLPDAFSPVLTRELIYTGITRARKRVEIWGKREVFVEAVSRRVERSSGLKDALGDL